MNQVYATELSDDQWEVLEPLLPAASRWGRPREVDLRQVLSAIFYVLVSGCAWALIPQEYPAYSTVYYDFRKWRDDGTWKHIHDHLVMWVRVTEGREVSPSVASLDSQSVPTAVMVHHQVGYDAAKKVKGRKRFTLVDTLGLLLAVEVVAASVAERKGGKQLLQQVHAEQRFPRLIRIWVDGGFSGLDFLKWVFHTCWWVVETVLRPEGSQGFVILPKRWTVERTYGWLHWYRRLNLDYERLPESSESFIYIGMIRTMVRRLS